MGVTKTILLPAGRPVNTASTHNGVANGLQAQCLGNEFCYRFAKAHPKHYLFAACEVPDLPDAVQEIEKYLKLGGVAIAELKFGVECDSPEMQRLYELAADYRVPVLMHWQHKMYTYGFERFHTMLEKYPKTTFIGHAQTWWANIDKNHAGPVGALSQRQGHPGRHHRPLPERLPEHVWRPVRRLRPQRASPATKTTPASSFNATRTSCCTAATATISTARARSAAARR